MRIHVLQHVPFEGIGSIQHWIDTHDHSLSFTRFFADDPLPQQQDYDRLIVMGGPMNIYEEDIHPWLIREKAFLSEAIQKNKTIIGICLGAQLLASALGAKVFANKEKEIGWFPVRLTSQAQAMSLFAGFPASLQVVHWHGDTFSPPSGAVNLATSTACENQAFLYNDRILGLQFHLESTPESLNLIVNHCRDEITDGSWIQEEKKIINPSPDAFAAINKAIYDLLDRLP